MTPKSIGKLGKHGTAFSHDFRQHGKHGSMEQHFS